MKVLGVLFVAIFGLLVCLQSMTSSATAAADAAARVPLENYIQGHATGNGDFMRKAFHSDAKVMAFRDGKLTNLTSEEFASRFNGKPAADEAQRKRRIEHVEITGNAGVAKIVLDKVNDPSLHGLDIQNGVLWYCDAAQGWVCSLT